MLVVLLGYMGSGKSLVGAQLASKLKFDFLDLDEHIEQVEGHAISDIFAEKGEIYFRKVEHYELQKILRTKTKTVLSLGGGTPCYYNNMEFLKDAENCRSFYLKVNIAELTSRLFSDKDKRPLIAHLQSKDQLTEFIGKHLFERMEYYEQADHILDVSHLSSKEVMEKIVLELFQDRL